MVSDIATEVLNFLIEGVAKLGEGITFILPKWSPFDGVESLFGAEAMGYINYFLPIEECVNTLVAWGVAILLWYGWAILLRWVKAVE